MDLQYQCSPNPFLPYTIKLQNNGRIMFAPLSRPRCYNGASVSNRRSVRGLIEFKTAQMSSLAAEGEHFPKELVARYLFIPAECVEMGCGSGYKARLPFSPPLTVPYQRNCLPCVLGYWSKLKSQVQRVGIHYFGSFDPMCTGQET